jgi:hypothetical protein
VSRGHYDLPTAEFGEGRGWLIWGSLSPSEGSVVELGGPLQADRTDTLLFVLEVQVTSSNAAGTSESSGISVAPDGSVTRG